MATKREPYEQATDVQQLAAMLARDVERILRRLERLEAASA